MNYYQVEFKNPDDFFKTQTNDFITSNHLIFFERRRIILSYFSRKLQ